MKQAWVNYVLLFFSMLGASESSCDSTHFLDAMKCRACPPHTHRESASQNYCNCVQGFYSKNATGSCTTCPQGAICLGSTELPTPKHGFFGVLGSDDFVKCINCAGNYTCFEGFSGTLCARPIPGRYLFGVQAAVCPTTSSSVGSLIEAAVALVSAAFVLILLVRVSWFGMSDHFEAFWHQLQVMSVFIQLSNIEWFTSSHSYVNIVSDIIMLDTRPLSRLLIGCDLWEIDADSFYYVWGLALAPLACAISIVMLRWISGRVALPELVCLFRLLTPVLVVASSQALSCSKV